MNSVARKNTRPMGTSYEIPMAAARPSASNRLSKGLVRQTRWLNWILALPLLVFLSAPLVALFLRIPLERLIPNLSNPQVHNAITLSLSTTVVTVLITLVLGMPVGYLLAHKHLPMRRLVDTLVDLPTVLPPAVAGVALLLTFGRRGMLGSALEYMGIHIAFTPVAVILAQTFVAAPYFIKAAALGFSSVDPELKHAAAIDGANGWQTLTYVTLPLAWSAMVSGAVMTWARAMGEFGATMIFAGNYPGRTQTMPLAIYLGFELNLDVALTLAAILVCSSFLVLMVVKYLLRRDTCTCGRY